MDNYNSIRMHDETTIKEGDRVEVIIKSAIYCNVNEKPIYQTGTILEFVFNEEIDSSNPIGMYVNLDNNTSGESQEFIDAELIYFNEAEQIFLKKYDIIGYTKLNKGMTLSIKGAEFGMIIRFNYIEGSLVPETIKVDECERSVSKEDKEFISEVLKYGSAQQLLHHVLSNSEHSKVDK